MSTFPAVPRPHSVSPALPGYRPLAGPATATVWLLGATAALFALGVVARLFEGSLLLDVAGGGDVSQGELELYEALRMTSTLPFLLLLPATFIAFLAWFSRGYRNLAALGATGLRYTPGWAVGAWFVPILNWFRPKAMADDMWRASDPSAPAEQGERWAAQPPPELVTRWWTVYIGSGVLGSFAVLTEIGGYETIGAAQAGSLVNLAADAAAVFAAWTAVVLVRQLTQRQEERARLLALAAVGEAA